MDQLADVELARSPGVISQFDWLSETAHRPWPIPSRPWSIFMIWRDLAFLHWPIPADTLRPLIPSELDLDLWEGQAWIGVVPFRMSGIRQRLLPPLPGTSAFPELNVRTYVTAEGKPGVWFFSLDAPHWLAVRVARAVYHLPYFDSWITCADRDGGIHYASQRKNRRGPAAAFRAEYWPIGEVYQACPGTFDYWLTERYCLYAGNFKNRLWRCDVHHRPWPLQPARVEIAENSLTRWLGFNLSQTPVACHFAKYLETVAYPMERVTLRAG